MSFTLGEDRIMRCPVCGKSYPGRFAFCPDDATALEIAPAVRQVYVRAALLSSCVLTLAVLAGAAIHQSVAGKSVPTVSSPPTAASAGLQAPVSSPVSVRPVQAPASPAAVPDEAQPRRLVLADLEGKSRSELDIMRNEPYARHGYRFRRPEIAAHFQAMPWYRPDTSDQVVVQSRMSTAERYNAAFILEFERSHP